MREKVEAKLKELEESYDYWLEMYDKDPLEYQEQVLRELKEKIYLLKELLEG